MQYDPYGVSALNLTTDVKGVGCQSLHGANLLVRASLWTRLPRDTLRRPETLRPELSQIQSLI